MNEDIQMVKPLTRDEIKALADRFYAGELKDLAHLRGIRAAMDAPIPYEGDVEF